MDREHVSFPGSRGARLVGRLESPAGETTAYALFAHCFTCSKDLKSAGAICRELTARGIAVLRFDFTGIGESGGDFAATDFSSNVEDLIAAADFLRRVRRAPALLVGHSLGATAMLAAAPRIPEAVAVATIGAPSDTGHLRRLLTARLARRQGEASAPPAHTAELSNASAAPDAAGVSGDAAATNQPASPASAGAPKAAGDPAGGPDHAGLLGGGDDDLQLDLGGPRPVRIRRQLLDDLAADHLRGALAHLGKALLIFHSPVDRVVGIENADRLFLEARHPKSFVSLGSADHLLSDPRDAAHVGAVLAAWAGRYLESQEVAQTIVQTAAAGTAAASPALAAGEVEVAGTAPTLRQEVRAGIHHLVADEPVADGGTDAGPTPYGLLLAALGACTAITMRLYANRKQLPLEEARVRLRHSRTHAKDCEDCAESDAMLERIELDLELLGPLTEDQRARLAAIANRCPVHRTLTSHLDIVTRLV